MDFKNGSGGKQTTEKDLIRSPHEKPAGIVQQIVGSEPAKGESIQILRWLDFRKSKEPPRHTSGTTTNYKIISGHCAAISDPGQSLNTKNNQEKLPPITSPMINNNSAGGSVNTAVPFNIKDLNNIGITGSGSKSSIISSPSVPHASPPTGIKSSVSCQYLPLGPNRVGNQYKSSSGIVSSSTVHTKPPTLCNKPPKPEAPKSIVDDMKLRSIQARNCDIKPDNLTAAELSEVRQPAYLQAALRHSNEPAPNQPNLLAPGGHGIRADSKASISSTVSARPTNESSGGQQPADGNNNNRQQQQQSGKPPPGGAAPPPPGGTAPPPSGGGPPPPSGGGPPSTGAGGPGTGKLPTSSPAPPRASRAPPVQKQVSHGMFSSNTLQGRANVAKVTLGAVLVGMIYLKMQSRKSEELGGNPMIMSQPKSGNPLLDGSHSNRTDDHMRSDSGSRTPDLDEGQTIPSDNYERPITTKPVPVNISTLQDQQSNSVKTTKNSNESNKSPAADPIFRKD